MQSFSHQTIMKVKLKNPGMYGWIMLKWVLRRLFEQWTGCVWLGTGNSGVFVDVVVSG
jgi:hypothetical protein